MSRLPATTMTSRFAPRSPATGIARWLVGEGSMCPVTGNRFLQVEVTLASGQKVAHDYEVENLGSDGIALHYLDPETFQVVTHRISFRGVNDWRCDCKDAEHGRQGCCKHIRALREALAKLPL